MSKSAIVFPPLALSILFRPFHKEKSFSHPTDDLEKLNLVKFAYGLKLEPIFALSKIDSKMIKVTRKLSFRFTRDIIAHNIAIKRYFWAVDLYKPR